MLNKFKKFLFLLMVFILVFTASGCYDIRELDSLYIVTGMAMDKAEQPGLIEVSVQIAKPGALGSGGGGDKKGGGGEEKATIIIDSVKRNVIEALEALRHDSSRTLFMHHNQVLIFGREQAEAGILPYLDASMRDQETRLEVMVLVADEKAKDVLNTEIKAEKYSAVGIRRMVDNKRSISKFFGIDLLTLVSKLTEETTSPLLPIIKIVEEEDLTRLSLTGMAVFKKDKMIGKITEYQLRGYSWVMGELKSGYLPVKLKQGSSVMYVKSSKNKLNTIFKPDGKPIMSMEIEGVFSVGELMGFEEMDTKQIVDELKKGAEQAIRKEIMSCFKSVQSMKADIYGFGDYINKHHPKKWKTLKPQWEELFPSLELDLKIKVEIKDTGKILQSLQIEIGRLS
ncbi:MAG: Ger(x)C family spore germination protein [Oscillospiraceae bacterium]|nr:Ger(x)C family spore germination protein [Oscillospiraceae bacterium]